MDQSKTGLIVTGVARSGTTALAELLNSHEMVCIGIERFKFQYLLANNYDRGLFTQDRYFDFRDDDTNLRPAVRPHWQHVYDQIENKWADAQIIGDKVPDLIPVLTDFLQANPDFKSIVLLRNLKDTALSWQKRANKSSDRWPAGKGFGEACKSWSEQMKILHDIYRRKAHRSRILLLDYDEMYANPQHTERAVLTYLDLLPSQNFRDTLMKHVRFAQNARKRKVPPAFVEIYKSIEKTDMRLLKKEARQSLYMLAGSAEGMGPDSP